MNLFRDQATTATGKLMFNSVCSRCDILCMVLFDKMCRYCFPEFFLVLRFYFYFIRAGKKFFARKIMEGKDEGWKREILDTVLEVNYEVAST